MPELSVRPLGGRSLHFSESIASQFIPYGAGNWAVYAEREATLTEDLSKVEDRYLRYIRVIWNNGGLDLSRDHATWLRDALTAALEATVGDEEVPR